MKAPEPHISNGMMKVFLAYCRRRVGRDFHALRLLRSGPAPDDDTRPLVVYCNHASWWDPLVCLLLAREFFPGRSSFGPMDSAMLQRYGIFKRLGFFGVDGSMRGMRAFLRTTHDLLADARHAVWLTPQGRFADVRERPLRLRGGLGALALREPEAAFVPLAIEYAFWTEPRPEILVSFGEPIVPGRERIHTCDEWTGIFTGALEKAQDKLAASSCRRASAEWQAVNHGKSGVNGIFDAWLWLKAWLNGEKFNPEHPKGVTR
jgi:1-acyl-sn-glycerol-3-phosphate acyltransferase